jgi:hypothetical protein
MSAAQRDPLGSIPKPAIKGPQLVPAREKAAAQVSAEAIARGDPHPLAAAFLIAGIALMGAITFAGSVLTWLLVRNTGVNWMFDGR